MGIILFVCAGEAYQAFCIPDRHQLSPKHIHSIFLDKQSLSIRESIELKLSEDSGAWSFSEDENKAYQVYLENQPFTRNIINSNIYHIKTIHRNQLWMLACTDVCICEAHVKYLFTPQSQITIGKEQNNHIQYHYADFISAKHAVIQKNEQECLLTDKSLNGIFVNGRRVSKSQKLYFADVIRLCGLELIYLGEVLAVRLFAGALSVDLQMYAEEQTKCIRKEETKKEHTLYHRAPRAVLYIDCEPIELEAPPNFRGYIRQPLLLAIGPALTMTVPMLLGFAVTAYNAKNRSSMGGSFLYTGLITAIASGVLGTLWAVMNVRQNRKRYVEEENKRRNSYEAYIANCEEKIREKYEHNAHAMRGTYPPAESCCMYHEHNHVLWNRNVGHDDFLVHRIGTGEALFQAKVQVPKEKFMVETDELPKLPNQLMKKYQKLYDVPICVDLNEHRMVGCIGDAGINGRNEIMRILTAQIAANHPYTEVKIVFLLQGRRTEGGEDRSYVRWFPHVWSEDRKIRYVDFGEGCTEEILNELVRIFRQRLENSGNVGNTDQAYRILPHYIFFIEQYKRLEGELIEKYIFSQAVNCGVSVILFASLYEELPNSCTYIIQNDSFFSGIYDIGGTSELRQSVSPDHISAKVLSAFGRRLAGIKTTETQSGAQIPDSLTLFELFGIRQPQELDFQANWEKSRADIHLRAPIGKKTEDAICYLDIHEKAHGPHGLIAGMTGSGKSELLQTYIISMAVLYSPEDVGFFLIDYKGGGMANLFSNLPHVVGSISNLSGNAVHRAMVSIKSENRRRQEMFQHCGVNNIHEYSVCYHANEVDIPLPHILIIIDEFAELKKEEPEFMKELISVAQVGRSLGVHLILATQKPGGTVDDNIRSNARFRLCLRVQDRQDSNDMLHKADAAYITRTGRAYLQVGNDELYEMFQTAWSGAVYEDESKQQLPAAQLIDIAGRTEHHAKRKAMDTNVHMGERLLKKTQLETVIEQMNQSIQMRGGYHKTQLWLPQLPNRISLSELDMLEEVSAVREKGIEVAVGRYDHPRRQLQDTLFLRLTEGGHHVICGMVTSGKSTFLQTAIYAMIQKYSPDEINIYIIDYSSQTLSPFQQAPQVGAFIGENDITTIKKLFLLMKELLEERKRILQGGSFLQYIKTIKLLPAIVLVIDQIAMFKEKTEGIFDNELLELSRVGEACGIYLLVTAGGFGSGELSNRIAENFRTSICLSMSDRYQYASILRVMRTQICPEAGIKGRGLVCVDGDILEFQTALVFSTEDDFARMNIIEEKCQQMKVKWGKKPVAREIMSIPEPLTYAIFAEQHKVRKLMEMGQYLPIGYFAESAHICSLDLSKLYCFLITGSGQSGKSNLRKAMMQTAKLMGAEVIFIRKEEDEKAVFELYEHLSEMFSERNRKKVALEEGGLITDDIYREMRKEPCFFVFIEDFADWVVKHYTGQLQRAEPLIQNLIERGSLHHIYFVAEYDCKHYGDIAGRGIYKAFAEYKTGIHFGGCVGGQRLFDFSYVPYSEQDKGLSAGIGMLPRMSGKGDEEYGKVVTPRVTGIVNV